MQRWKNQLADHPINQTISQLKQIIDYDYPIADPIALSEFTRLVKVANLFIDTIENIDTDITPINLINNV